MTTIVTRSGKGSPLTHVEVDANFTNLNNDKLDVAGIAAGSAASPTLKFTGDTNTGLYSPGADQVALATGGVGRLFVDASGNVGIGTDTALDNASVAAANYRGLTLQTAIAANRPTLSFRNTGSGGLAYIQGIGQDLAFGAASQDYGGHAERLRITSAGLVGIGTSSPTQTLHVENGNLINASLTFGASAIQTIRGTFAGSGIRELAIGVTGDSPNSPYLQARNNSSTAQALLLNPAGGNVGICTSAVSDGCVLTIQESASAGAAFGLRNRNSTQTWRVAVDAAAIDDKILAFIDGGSSTVRMALTDSGRLGIGTTPAYTLDVNGTVNVVNGSNGRINLGATTNYLYGDSAGNLIAGNSGGDRVQIDASGRLLVGTSSARTPLTHSPSIQVEGVGYAASTVSVIGNSNDSNGAYVFIGKSRGTTVGSNTVVQSGDEIGGLDFIATDGTQALRAARITANVDGTPGANDMPSRLVFSTTADAASSPTERMRIRQDGNILFGKTALDFSVAGIQTEAGSTSLTITRTSGDALTLRRNTDNGDIVSFYRDGTKVGSISVTASATAYNTSSDYRLKENVTAVTGAIARLQELKPSRFNFIADPSKTVDGFLAHEVQDVVPEAITGQKDAVDDDGNPVYQGIDQSKLVPLLTAALQEAVAKIEGLEARLTAAGI